MHVKTYKNMQVFQKSWMCKFNPCMFSHKINDTSYKNLEAEIDKVNKSFQRKMR